MKHKIEITGPKNQSFEWTAEEECSIGRSQQNSIVLNDEKVSFRHALIRLDGEKIKLKDLDSTNGIFVDGEKVVSEKIIAKKSEIQIGPFTVKIVFPDEKSKKPTKKEEDLFNPFLFLKPFLEPVQRYLDDDSVSEIMINGPENIFIERSGRIQKVPERFSSLKALIAAAKNIGRAIGKEVSEQRPTMDARLEDGSRVCVIMAPCSLDGAAIAIRKFFKKKLTMDRLISFGSISQDAIELMQTAVMLKKNIIVSGGTGSGKTSLLNAMSSMIPNEERIVVIEDSAELQLQKDHLVRLEARQEDEKGRYEVSIRDLLKSTLRMRPDRIVIGEIRGGEAFDLLQAMNTGHGGSMSTIHSNSPMDTLLRLENTTLQSEEAKAIPHFAIQQQISSTIDLVVHTSRYPDGSRKVSHITEILGLDQNNNYNLQNLIRFKVKTTDNGKIIGSHEFSGKLPTFVEDIENYGLEIPAFLKPYL